MLIIYEVLLAPVEYLCGSMYHRILLKKEKKKEK